jgi:hypothetical protein
LVRNVDPRNRRRLQRIALPTVHLHVAGLSGLLTPTSALVLSFENELDSLGCRFLEFWIFG